MNIDNLQLFNGAEESSVAGSRSIDSVPPEAEGAGNTRKSAGEGPSRKGKGALDSNRGAESQCSNGNRKSKRNRPPYTVRMRRDDNKEVRDIFLPADSNTGGAAGPAINEATASPPLAPAEAESSVVVEHPDLGVDNSFKPEVYLFNHNVCTNDVNKVDLNVIAQINHNLCQSTSIVATVAVATVAPLVVFGALPVAAALGAACTGGLAAYHAGIAAANWMSAWHNRRELAKLMRKLDDFESGDIVNELGNLATLSSNELAVHIAYHAKMQSPDRGNDPAKTMAMRRVVANLVKERLQAYSVVVRSEVTTLATLLALTPSALEMKAKLLLDGPSIGMATYRA